MLLKDRILACGVGQCGGNYVKELENLEWHGYYINTSLEDLDTILTDMKNKYHIKGTKGMAKDRGMAIQCILNDDKLTETICDSIHHQYAMCDIIFFFTSLNGGTGGTMTAFIAEVMADLYPDKIINVVAVKGKKNEDVGLQANGIEALKHLKKLYDDGIISQLHILDNDTRDDKYSINKDFAIALDKFVSSDNITEEGNLDEEEKEKILTEAGMAVIMEFENEDFANGLASARENTIYSDWIKMPSLHGIILNRRQNKEPNKDLIHEVLGMPKFTHSTTWEEDGNILYACGMPFNDTIINQLNKNAIELSEKKRLMEEESMKAFEVKDEVAFDTTSVLLSRNRRRQPQQQNTQTNVITNRRRGERNASSVLDKYRNMNK